MRPDATASNAMEPAGKTLQNRSLLNATKNPNLAIGGGKMRLKNQCAIIAVPSSRLGLYLSSLISLKRRAANSVFA